MTVFRVHKNENFTVLSNYHFKEREMSLKAKGLLSLMLSLPETWDYSAAGLVKLSKDGKDSVNATLKELEKFGYLKRTQVFNDNGTFGGYNYEIFEKPNTDAKTEKPSTDKPFTEKPSTGNPQQLNNKELNNKELSIKEGEGERKTDNSRTTYDAIINGKIFDDKVKKALYEFIKMRAMIKKPLTNFALEITIDKLLKMSLDPNTQVEILENAVFNNWHDIKKPTQAKKTTSNVTPLFGEDIDEEDKLNKFGGLLLSDNQVTDLLNKMGLEMFNRYCQKLEYYIDNNGDVVKSHYATIMKWYKEDTAVAR
jgi:hypothetical protein